MNMTSNRHPLHSSPLTVPSQNTSLPNHAHESTPHELTPHESTPHESTPSQEETKPILLQIENAISNAKLTPIPRDNIRHMLLELKRMEQRVNCRVEEAEMCRLERTRMTVELDAQLVLLTNFEREMQISSRLWNSRVLFYKILQKLSDDVALTLEGKDSLIHQQSTDALLISEKQLLQQLEEEEIRCRYLTNLTTQPPSSNAKSQSLVPSTLPQTLCGICKLELGDENEIAVTQCGVGDQARHFNSSS